MSGEKVFDQHVQRYDRWFDEHPVWFESELKVLAKAVPYNEFGLEIGAGTDPVLDQKRPTVH